MHRKLLYSITGFFAAALILTLYMLFSSSQDPHGSPASVNIHKIFSSDTEYIDHIRENVRFRDITLTIVEIRKGDNFWKIAKDHGVNIDTLIGSNPHWDALTAKLNQRIVVPSRIGVLHFITDFSEIDELAALYSADREKIVLQKLPPLYRAYYRIISDRKPIAVFVPDARPTTLTMTDSMAQKFALRERFRSPLGGRFSSYFGGRIHPIFREYGFHNGVDIATQYGTAVGAAAAGIVAEAGWMGGYGKAVIINHPDGYKTLYGHLSSILVAPGQSVKPGRLIGRVGSTGWSTGPHLHFTLWHNGRLINPMKVLW